MYVYFILAKSAKPRKLKIGKSRHPEKRLHQLQTGCPHELSLVGKIKCRSDKDALLLEQAAHEYFHGKHHRGEWFKCSDFILHKVWEFTGINQRHCSDQTVKTGRFQQEALRCDMQHS